MSDASWIVDRLPPIERIERRCEPDYYGASHLIARALGLPQVPRSFASWTHAWQIDPTTHERQILTIGKEPTTLVATDEHCRLLMRAGYRRVAPVGLPYVYADDYVQVERRPRSLLIMPAHTINNGEYDWDEQAYVRAIAELRPHFSCIVACVQANCVKQGYWMESFKKYDIPWITGAGADDRNAQIRIATILKSFAYVTTNRIASHVAYAAYAGCKVSVFGQYLAPQPKNYANHLFFQDHPEVLRLNIERAQESAVRQRYPQFFTVPTDAVDQRDWASKTLGAPHRRSHQEIAELLGWTRGQQLAGHARLARAYLRRRSASMFRSIKKRLPGRRRAA